MNPESEVKVLDLATFGDLSDALQNFASDGNDITARFISHLETQVSEMEEVCTVLQSRMEEAAWRLEEARNDVSRAESSLSFCESQVYTSISYDDEGNSYEETVYPDCSYESAHLSRCEDARYDAARAYEAAEELYYQSRGLLTAAQESYSSFQGHIAHHFQPLLHSHTPAACRKLAAIATDLYGYLDTRFDSNSSGTNKTSAYQQSASGNSHSTIGQTVASPTISHQTKPRVSTQVLQEENDHYSLSFRDKLNRNVEAKWTYKEGHSVHFESLTCNGKNVLPYPHAVQFTIKLHKDYDKEKDDFVVKSRTMHIGTIYLLDEYQGAGIGGEIVRQLEVLAKEKGCLSIDTFAENERSATLFKKMDFEYYIPGDGTNYRKILSPNPTEDNHEQ